MAKIIANRYASYTMVNIDDVNWSIKRAFQDGRLAELRFFEKLLSDSED